MTRREFIMLLGGAAAAWPLAVRAQKNDGVRRVGVIMGFADNDGVWQAYLASFRKGLQDLGWTDGHNIRFDYRFTGDSEERMRAMAEEVVSLTPDVIFVSTNSVVSATLKATRSMPAYQGTRLGYLANWPAIEVATTATSRLLTSGFSPITQGKKFDPHGRYVRHWCPNWRAFLTSTSMSRLRVRRLCWRNQASNRGGIRSQSLTWITPVMASSPNAKSRLIARR
jgi:DNA photolyase-like FAD binding protein